MRIEAQSAIGHQPSAVPSCTPRPKPDVESRVSLPR